MSRRVTAWVVIALMGCWGALSRVSSRDSVSAPAAPALPRPAADSGAGHAEPRTHELIPARVRRLSNAEYNGSVRALLGTELAPGLNFAPDARQAGFTENEAQQIDTVFAKQLSTAAEKLAAEARAKIAPCIAPAHPEDCARFFIDSFGARAYRRPLLDEESSGLLAVFRAGALDASYEDGIELVMQAVLQSAGFLYISELGTPSPDNPDEVVLTGAELASSLAYLVTGGPPDQTLLDAAAAGALDVPELRLAQLQRLRAQYPESRDHLVRVLREWLQLDTIENTAKDIAFYPTYESMWRYYIAESHDFIAAVLDQNPKQGSDLSTLLGADWTVGHKNLGDFYGAKELPGGKLQLATRRGILNQGAFLSVQSHARSSAPVLRGVLIARRLACIPVASPGTVGLSPLPPLPDPKLTTRQRFDLHATNPICAECHEKTDDFGNAFEQYDGMGGLRQTENSLPIDTATVVALGSDFDGTYSDSNALAVALAGSASVRECFARNLFRAAAARSIDSSGAAATAASEDAFVSEWRTLPEAARGNVLDTLSAFVSSRLFTHRRIVR